MGQEPVKAASCETKAEEEALQPAFNEDGVDLTLIRRVLEMTPLERLRYADECAQAIEAIWRQNSTIVSRP